MRYWLAKHGLRTSRSDGVSDPDNIRKRKDRTCLYCGGKLTHTQAKYCSVDCQEDYKFEATFINGNPKPKTDRRRLRRWLLGQRGNQCECCNLAEWLGQEISIELHHVDGNSHIKRKIVEKGIDRGEVFRYI
ncbi:MAG: hypothetical protein AAFU54_05255 [Chloroflexota bacterium]